jgi:hypothetical protein
LREIRIAVPTGEQKSDRLAVKEHRHWTALRDIVFNSIEPVDADEAKPALVHPPCPERVEWASHHHNHGKVLVYMIITESTANRIVRIGLVERI